MGWSMYVHAFQSVFMSIGVDRQVPNLNEFLFKIILRWYNVRNVLYSPPQ